MERLQMMVVARVVLVHATVAVSIVMTDLALTHLLVAQEDVALVFQDLYRL